MEQVDAGVPLAAALAAWAKRSGSTEAIQVAAGLQLAIEAGGPQVAAIENLASSLRERLAVTKEAHALATQARASAVVIAVAPVLFGLLLGLGDRRASAFLFGSGAGVACLAGGIALDGLGAWWMWRITRSVR
jgi:tight adherence protein B